MTTSPRPLTIDYTDGAPLAPEDPRARMARSVQAAGAVIAQLDATNAVEPTPCSEWTAGDVARHLVAVLDRAAAGPSGRALDDLPILAEVDVDGLAAAFHASALELHTAWADEATLDQPVMVPWGTLTGRQAMSTYAAEVLLHAWDLAVAIGVTPNWPATDIDVHYEMAQQAFPADQRGPFVPFDDVAADPGTTSIERLAAWMGRDTEPWSLSR